MIQARTPARTLRLAVLLAATPRISSAGILTIGLLLAAPSAVAETLLASYFDITTNSPAGAEVTGKIHLLSNKDAHQTPPPSSYSFSITADPSGVFAVEDQRDSDGLLFGVLKVAPGQSVSVTPMDYPLTVALMDGVTPVASTGLVVHATNETLLSRIFVQMQDFPIAQNRLYGRKNYSDNSVSNFLDELEGNSFQFTGFDFYTNDILSYTNSPGTVGDEWVDAANRIGGMGKAYYTSPVYGPGGDPVRRARLKAGLYGALEAFIERVPVAGEDLVVDGTPVSTDMGDGFMRLSEDLGIESFNYLSHQWPVTDPIAGAATWLIPEIFADAREGDAQALALHEKLVRFFQLCFAATPQFRKADDPGARWGMLTDTNHTEGAFSDANRGHRSRSWLCLLAIWADYNRPITYVPYYYRGYFTTVPDPDFLYKPGWTPRGVLEDITFWTSHFHSPAHQFVQSGFQPDGTVSHHLSDASDTAMYAYGYPWLTDVINGYELLQDLPTDLGSDGYQFIADTYLYSYDRIVYKNYLDYTVTGRNYFVDDGTRLADRMPAMIGRLLAAKQSGTVITNETELNAWRTAIDNGSHEQSGNTPFWVGNYMVHRRGGGGETPFFMSVKMENDRTSGAEDFEGVKKSWHAGSGILQVMVRGDEYDATRREMDWHALPGLTEEWRTDIIVYNKDYLRGGSAYSGMASDKRYGFAAMEYRSPAGSYSVANADKAFFFAETEAIALGCNVSRSTAGQNLEIVTTVDQTLWNGTLTYAIDGGTPVTIPAGTDTSLTLRPTEPSWIHQGSVGYVIFPEPAQPLYIRGAADVNKTMAGFSTVDVIQFVLGHGVDPAASGLTNYHYAVVPNVSAAQMPAYVVDLTNRIEIVSNGGGVQGIRDASLDLVQLVFYGAGTAQLSNGLQVEVDRVALVQLRQTNGTWEVCATDPLHEYAATELNVTLNLPLQTGVYPYRLPGIHPRPGETMTVTDVPGGVKVAVSLPDPTDDAGYNYQAELYAGAPIHSGIATLYQSWAESFGLSGTNALMLADPDGDTKENLWEYAIGENPTNATEAAALSPVLVGPDGADFHYVYRRRSDHERRWLQYIVESSTNLIDNIWTTSGVAEAGFGPVGDGFESVTNELETLDGAAHFFRLKIRSE
jgi:chondroitin AC lyase